MGKFVHVHSSPRRPQCPSVWPTVPECCPGPLPGTESAWVLGSDLCCVAVAPVGGGSQCPLCSVQEGEGAGIRGGHGCARAVCPTKSAHPIPALIKGQVKVKSCKSRRSKTHSLTRHWEDRGTSRKSRRGDQEHRVSDVKQKEPKTGPRVQGPGGAMVWHYCVQGPGRAMAWHYGLLCQRAAVQRGSTSIGRAMLSLLLQNNNTCLKMS